MSATPLARLAGPALGVPSPELGTFPFTRHNGPVWSIVVLAGAGILVLGYLLHRLALWAEGRGWIYYKNKGRPGGVGLGLIGQIYQPSIEHVVDEQQSERMRADQDDSGDAPAPPA